MEMYGKKYYDLSDVEDSIRFASRLSLSGNAMIGG